jgi:hypothetical protein
VSTVQSLNRAFFFSQFCVIPSCISFLLRSAISLHFILVIGLSLKVAVRVLPVSMSLYIVVFADLNYLKIL